jgi:hypothetical protein
MSIYYLSIIAHLILFSPHLTTDFIVLSNYYFVGEVERWTRKMGLSKQWYGSLLPSVWKFVSAQKGIYKARLQKSGVGLLKKSCVD